MSVRTLILFSLLNLIIFSLPSPAQITVDSSFEGANFKVISVNNSTNTIKIESVKRPGDIYNVVFFASISGFSTSVPLKIQVRNTQQYQLPYLAAYSNDKINWSRINGTYTSDYKEYVITNPVSPLYFSHGFPYLYSDLLNLASRVSSSPYGQVTDVAQSLGCRGVKLFRITGSCVNDSAKYLIWLIGRNHAMEHHSNYVIEGFVDFLLSNKNYADMLRRQAIIYVVPVMDVDKAANGGTGKDQLPVDFNRDWDSPSYWSAVIGVKQKILETSQQNQLKIFIDSHNPYPGQNNSSDKLWFYSLYNSGPKSVNLDFYRKLLQENCGYSFGRQLMYPTNGQASKSWVDSMITSVDFAVSLETGWVDRTDYTIWTIPLYRYNGEALARGMCDYLNNIILPSDIILDNTDTLNGVTISGSWISSTYVSGYWGSDYIHDNNTDKGQKSVLFKPVIPSSDYYKVFIRWTSDPGRANNVPVRIAHSGGIKDTVLNQQSRGSEWVFTGMYYFNAGNTGAVLIKNNNTTQYVIVDAVRFSRINNCNPIGVLKYESRVADSYALFQNSPNPFNPVTAIKFDIPISTLVKLKIYDILGREITTLVNEILNIGTYSVSWNAGDYPSGIYFCRLETPDFSDAKRIVLVK